IERVPKHRANARAYSHRPHTHRRMLRRCSSGDISPPLQSPPISNLRADSAAALQQLLLVSSQTAHLAIESVPPEAQFGHHSKHSFRKSTPAVPAANPLRLAGLTTPRIR